MKEGKKGQTKISFGMIFSIILIIIFIAFAIYGINKFLKVNELATVEKFKSDFQGDINNMWKSTSGSQRVEYNLPKKITYLCFKSGDYENMYFMPSEYGNDFINNVDIEKTLESAGSNKDNICIKTSSSKISLIIEKDHDENLVTIRK